LRPAQRPDRVFGFSAGCEVVHAGRELHRAGTLPCWRRICEDNPLQRLRGPDTGRSTMTSRRSRTPGWSFPAGSGFDWPPPSSHPPGRLSPDRVTRPCSSRHRWRPGADPGTNGRRVQRGWDQNR